jgi:hypothetical protein
MLSKVNYSAFSAAEIHKDILGRKRKCQLCGSHLEIDTRKGQLRRGSRMGTTSFS